MEFTLSSAAFENRQIMPQRYTRDGENLAPPLTWQNAPAGTRSFALIVEDPGVIQEGHPRQQWVHWVVYNIPADIILLPEDATRKRLPEGMREGVNDWNQIGYGGIGIVRDRKRLPMHRVIHRLYALDTTLPDLGQPTKSRLMMEMNRNILAVTELTAIYRRVSSVSRQTETLVT